MNAVVGFYEGRIAAVVRWIRDSIVDTYVILKLLHLLHRVHSILVSVESSFIALGRVCSGKLCVEDWSFPYEPIQMYINIQYVFFKVLFIVYETFV